MWGEYVKLIKTGEIVKNEGFNPKTQMMTIKTEQGLIFDVGGNEVARMTANEDLEFLCSKNKFSN